MDDAPLYMKIKESHRKKKKRHSDFLITKKSTTTLKFNEEPSTVQQHNYGL
jgi:hypothetical protein